MPASAPHSVPPLPSPHSRLCLCYLPVFAALARARTPSRIALLPLPTHALSRLLTSPPIPDRNSSSAPTLPLAHLPPVHTHAPGLPAAPARTLHPPPGDAPPTTIFRCARHRSPSTPLAAVAHAASPDCAALLPLPP